MNANSRGSAITILLGLDILFFVTAVALWCVHGIPESVASHVWEAFAGANGALLLILKADNDNHKSDQQNPLPPAGPAQPK